MKSEDKTIWSATPTPFLDGGALDVAAVERLIEHNAAMGVTGLFVAGSCGEGPLMPSRQRAELVKLVKQFAGDRMKVAAQVSDTSAARACENVREAEDAGADFVVIAPPWMPHLCKRDFARRYFGETIEAAEAPVGLYILRQQPGMGIDLPVWLEFVDHPKVKLIKDSSSMPEYIAALTPVRARRDDVMLLTGYEFGVVEAVAAGYDGGLLGTGILVAGHIRRALRALARGDREEADAWQRRSNDFLYDLFARDLGLWLGGLKYALVRQGLFSTEWMHHCYKLAQTDRDRIDAALIREAEILRPDAD